MAKPKRTTDEKITLFKLVNPAACEEIARQVDREIELEEQLQKRIPNVKIVDRYTKARHTKTHRLKAHEG